MLSYCALLIYGNIIYCFIVVTHVFVAWNVILKLVVFTNFCRKFHNLTLCYHKKKSKINFKTCATILAWGNFIKKIIRKG